MKSFKNIVFKNFLIYFILLLIHRIHKLAITRFPPNFYEKHILKVSRFLICIFEIFNFFGKNSKHPEMLTRTLAQRTLKYALHLD